MGERLLMDQVRTPIGELVLVVDDAGKVRAAGWTDTDQRMTRLLEKLAGASRAINPFGLSDIMNDYFSGNLAALDGISVATDGTEFQRSVWQELRGIPCGATCSYADVARRIGRPNAVRAVGLANGCNPVGVIVPCHRVIGANGTLTGYAGGIERKRWLLTHERAVLV